MLRARLRHPGLLLAGIALLAVSLVPTWLRPRVDPADALIRQFLDETAIPGAVVALGHSGQEPDVRAYGLADPAAGTAMQPDDRFKIASLSKPITAEAILVLVRRQQLSLDTRLVDVLPAVARSGDPRVAGITVRHLLQHSGGWDRAQTFDPFTVGRKELSDLIGVDASRLEDCAPVADALLARPLQFAPGSRYAYSNIGYCWLGRILAHLQQRPYEEAVHALLSETSAMTLKPSAVSVRHAVAEREGEYLVNVPAIIGPAGGWIASADAYFRFASRPLDSAVFDKPGYAAGRQYYGLGWRVWMEGSETVLTHFGALPGAFSVVIKKQNGPTFVALFNGRPASDEAAFNRLREAVTRLPAWRH